MHTSIEPLQSRASVLFLHTSVKGLGSAVPASRSLSRRCCCTNSIGRHIFLGRLTRSCVLSSPTLPSSHTSVKGLSSLSAVKALTISASQIWSMSAGKQERRKQKSVEATDSRHGTPHVLPLLLPVLLHSCSFFKRLMFELSSHGLTNLSSATRSCELCQVLYHHKLSFMSINTAIATWQLSFSSLWATL